MFILSSLNSFYIMYPRILLSIVMSTLFLFAGCDLVKEAPPVDPAPNIREALLQQVQQVNRFVFDYLTREPAIRASKPLSLEERRALLRNALLAYEQTSGMEGVVQGFDYATTYLKTAKRLDGVDSLLDDEQKRWLETLRTLFEEAHTLGELEALLATYEEAVQEALGEERATPLLYYAASLYATAYLIFSNDPVLDSLRTLLGTTTSGKRSTIYNRIEYSTHGNTTCPLNTMPTLGGQVEWADIVGILRDMLAGCVGAVKLTGWASIWLGSIPAGVACSLGSQAGLLFSLFIVYYPTWDQRFETESIAWCERNRSVCEGVEAYEAFCEEITRPQ